MAEEIRLGRRGVIPEGYVKKDVAGLGSLFVSPTHAKFSTHGAMQPESIKNAANKLQTANGAMRQYVAGHADVVKAKDAFTVANDALAAVARQGETMDRVAYGDALKAKDTALEALHKARKTVRAAAPEDIKGLVKTAGAEAKNVRGNVLAKQAKFLAESAEHPRTSKALRAPMQKLALTLEDRSVKLLGAARPAEGPAASAAIKTLQESAKAGRFLTGKNAAIAAGVGAVGYVGYKLLGGGKQEQPASFVEREEMRRAAVQQQGPNR